MTSKTNKNTNPNRNATTIQIQIQIQKLKIVINQVTRGLEERKATSVPRLPAALPLLSSPGAGSRFVIIIDIIITIVIIIIDIIDAIFAIFAIILITMIATKSMMTREGSSREGSQGYGTISNCSSSDKESTAGSDSSRWS